MYTYIWMFYMYDDDDLYTDAGMCYTYMYLERYSLRAISLFRLNICECIYIVVKGA